MPAFRKLTFPDQATFEELSSELNSFDFAVPIGSLSENSKEFSVDILFHEEIHESFTPYIVWPKPCGVHAFMGWEEQYAIDWEAYHNESKQEAK